MKKIILLFFTFSGICACFSQEPIKAAHTAGILLNRITNILSPKTDSIIKEKASFRMYPNPAKNKAAIEVKGFEAGYVKIQLMSSSGKLIREEKRLVLSGNEVIVFMFSEKPGLYFLFLKQGKTIVKNKLVIQ